MIHLLTLDNGIRIVTEPADNYRSAAFGLWIDAGSASETENNNGIAHVIEHMLFKGTKTKSARMLADEITAIGGNLDAYTTREYTCFSAHTLDIHLEHAVNIIADMVRNSLIDENDLQKELGVILDEIDMYEDDPEELAGDLIHHAIWKGQPMGFFISGRKEQVRQFTKKDVTDFMAQYYTGRHMVISVAGHFDETHMISVIRSCFGDMIPGEAAAFSSLPAPVYFQSQVFKHKPLEQMHINMAFPCIPYNHEQQYIYYIADNLIGSNQNSRLFQEIREERGLTYSVYSYSSSFKRCGVFQIYAAASPAQIPEVLNAIREVFIRLEKEPVTAHELTLIKAQIETELMIAAESTQSRMESNGEALIYHSKIDTLDKILKDIEAITLAEVQQFIEKYFLHVTPSLCIVGDLAQTDMMAVKNWCDS